MKRFFCLSVLFLILTSANAFAFDISANCACVMIADTGEIVYEKNSGMKHSMASTTKIMTGIIALEESEGHEIVTVSANAASQEGSSIYIDSGDKVTVNDLLYGMLLNSGNDAACAIAEHISGSVDEFAGLMTKRAHELGAVNTSFKNPNGLDEEGHYSTAKDMAIIASYALNNDKFKDIVSTKNNQINIGSDICYLKNHNKLLWNYDGCIGVKTGYTKKTGRCLVSAAERDGIRLIAVTLDAPDDWNDHKKMLDYGFSVTKRVELIKKDDILKSYSDFGGFNAVSSEDVCYSSADTKKVDSEVVLQLIKKPTVNIGKGEKIGYAKCIINGKIFKKVDLVCDREVRVSKNNESEFKKFIDIVKQLLVNLLI